MVVVVVFGGAFSLEFEGTLTDQVIPTLDDVLQLVDMKVELYIEIKEGSKSIELQLLKLLEKYDCYNAVSIISFDYHTLVWMIYHQCLRTSMIGLKV